MRDLQAAPNLFYNYLVKPATAAQISELNHQFYQNFAHYFSATRQKLQPGVRTVLERISPTANVLDLGCGNGELARELARRQHEGRYVGLDFSAELLAKASDEVSPALEAVFYQKDLTIPGWAEALPASPFDVIMAFAVLHHLPGDSIRLDVLHAVRRILDPQGVFIHSNWMFLNSPRLRARIQPWEKAGITPDEVDPGDYLLDWRHGGYGLRYAHHFGEAELARLAVQSGFKILDSFLSDGENGRLGLYQVWAPE
jgi:SAM-dependent methyltransferase